MASGEAPRGCGPDPQVSVRGDVPVHGDASRRDAVKLLLGGALASLPLLRARPGSEESTDVLVGDLAEIPVGSAASSHFHGLPILVIHSDEGPVVLSALCTHEGCMVTWERARGELLCPCHQGRFSGTGAVLEGPPPAPLLNLPVRVEDGKVYVVE